MCVASLPLSLCLNTTIAEEEEKNIINYGYIGVVEHVTKGGTRGERDLMVFNAYFFFFFPPQKWGEKLFFSVSLSCIYIFLYVCSVWLTVSSD